MSDNAAMEKCFRRTDQVWVECDHKYCWDPENCTDASWETVQNTDCKWTTIDAHHDKCRTCGMVYTY